MIAGENNIVTRRKSLLRFLVGSDPVKLFIFQVLGIVLLIN
jgi:hypothetical protein